MAKSKKIEVEGKEITIILYKEQEYISLTDTESERRRLLHFGLASQQKYSRISWNLGKRLQPKF